MLSCKELTEVVTRYLEGRMKLFERLKFELHVGMCKNCRAYLNQMKQTVKTLGKLPKEVVSPEMEADLLERFRGW